MERKTHIDKRQERTGKQTKKSGKAGPSRWEREPYMYKEELRDDQRPLHGDPRSKLERPQLDKHDNDSSDDDGDHRYNHPAFGISTTPDLNVSDSFASDQGTLAGDAGQDSMRPWEQVRKWQAQERNAERRRREQEQNTERQRREQARNTMGQMTTEQLRQFAAQAMRTLPQR
jgi:hypothetical protein